MSTGEIVTVIASTGAMLVAIVNAIAAGWGRQATREARAELVSKADESSEKLDAIRHATNGTLTAVYAKLAAQEDISKQAFDRILRLERLLEQSIASKEPGTTRL